MVLHPSACSEALSRNHLYHRSIVSPRCFVLAAIYGVFGSIVQHVSTANILFSQILRVAKFCYFVVSSVICNSKQDVENVCYTTMMSTALHRKEG